MTILKFENFIKEDATATAGNTGGMGGVVSSQPSSTPGDVAGSTPGSGDIGSTLGTFTKSAGFSLNNKTKKKKKNKKKKKLEEKGTYSNEQSKSYDQMYVVRFDQFKYTK